MARIGTDQAFVAGRGMREQIAAHVAGGETHRTHARDPDVGQILAYAGAQLEGVLDGRSRVGRVAVEREIRVDARVQFEQAAEQRAVGRKTPLRVRDDLGVGCGQRRIEDVLNASRVRDHPTTRTCAARVPTEARLRRNSGTVSTLTWLSAKTSSALCGSSMVNQFVVFPK